MLYLTEWRSAINNDNEFFLVNRRARIMAQNTWGVIFHRVRSLSVFRRVNSHIGVRIGSVRIR